MTLALIDLRSDTVTKPSPGMRRAMADVERAARIILETLR